jgi:ribonuclease BN (tRNA processing enzyme)
MSAGGTPRSPHGRARRLNAVRLTVVGCGDAFGSGGRANTCFWLEGGAATVAIDFGATSLVALKRMGLDPNRIDAILISHLHGDHFGGLPFLLLDAQFDSRRDTPLTIVGPIGLRERLTAAQEVFFPDSSKTPWRFALDVVDLPCGTPYRVAGLDLVTFEVVHPSGAPATALRLADGVRTLAYSGDTSWTDRLPEAARGADLLIVECYRLANAPANHLDLATLEEKRALLNVPRTLLTHMSDEVLAEVAAIEANGYEVARDGLVIEI